MRDDRYWRAVVERDAEFDGLFVFGVKTTGVYCRPSCPAKRPLRENVTFYSSSDEAAAAGFRPCRRCNPDQPDSASPGAEMIRRACEIIDGNPESPPSLKELGERVGISRYHLQRVFKKLTGVTPRQYADARRLESLRRELRTGRNVADAIYGAGYGSSSRVYERSAEQLGMTPDQYRRGGRGRTIRYAVVDSSLGRLLLAATDKGICRIKLGESAEKMARSLRNEFPSATIERNDGALEAWVEEVRGRIDGRLPSIELPTDVRATSFQRTVWEELRRIPFGETRSYSEVAAAIDHPRATRAVANACADNPVAIVIPCHRVIRKDGSTGGYGWGPERKAELLRREKKASSV